MGIALIVAAFIGMIFLAVGLQTCTYHPEFAGTPQYQECHFHVSVNWPYLVLALVLFAAGVALLRRKRAVP